MPGYTLIANHRVDHESGVRSLARSYYAVLLVPTLYASLACGVRHSPKESQPSGQPQSTVSVYRLDEGTRASLQLLAQAGDNVAAYRVSEHYLMGVGDPGQALEWLRLAATRGDIKSQVALGSLLHVYGDDRGAREWLERAHQAAALASDEANRRAALEHLAEIERHPSRPKTPQPK
jgi:TPR repeat protein